MAGERGGEIKRKERTPEGGRGEEKGGKSENRKAERGGATEDRKEEWKQLRRRREREHLKDCQGPGFKLKKD